jgi:3-dehydroquinate dehydratase-2
MAAAGGRRRRVEAAAGPLASMSQQDSIHLLNGPNLDLLGVREPEIYGRDTLADVEALCRALTAPHGLHLVCRQTNAEFEMVEALQAARNAAGIAINPAAFTYHAESVRDALTFCNCPIVEVHISNIYRRDESWRLNSIMSSAVTGVITGCGVDGYRVAMEFLIGLWAAGATGRHGDRSG